MSSELKLTTPKPFVFVLMPFDQKFNDIYKFGIKGAAEVAGAYAERLDEQIFTEGMLERIYNQINKADVIVADMTGQNPNVFYEVGYAHALGKIVLLLTQEADDIPFDLKHRLHIVYGGSIESLKADLTEKLIWGISESKRQKAVSVSERYEVNIAGINILESNNYNNVPTVTVYTSDWAGFARLKVHVRNNSREATPDIEYIYLFSSPTSLIAPWYFDHYDNEGKFEEPFVSNSSSTNVILSKQYKLRTKLPLLPPGAVDDFDFEIGYPPDDFEHNVSTREEILMLRIHSLNNIHDFPFKLKITDR